MVNVKSMTRRSALVGTLLLLGGCASFSPDGGFGRVNELTQERLNQQVDWQRTDAAREAASSRVAELLQAPLDAERAVQIALINNRGLQARFAEVGIAEAEYVQAGRLWNPVFGASGWRNQHGVESLLGIESNLLGLFLTPATLRFETLRFDYAKLNAAKAVIDLANETRKAYYEALGDEQKVAYFEQVKLAADASADLAHRMAAVGNISKRDQAREQVFYAETVARLARAKQQALQSREKLTRLMGLFGAQTAFKLPDTLPELPARIAGSDRLEARAIDQRLDVQVARKEIEYLGKGLGMTRATRFINVLNLGAQAEKKPEERRLSGPTLALELPLFDFGDARIARYEAQYRQGIDRLAETAVNARSEVRAAYPAYVSAYETARHYRNEIVPLRKKISEQNLLYYNGMLISVFELLADTREQVAAVIEYIDALRDFWVAESELRTALGGQPLDASVIVAAPAGPQPDAPAQTTPAQTAPAQTAPAQTAPAQTAPAQTAPAHQH